MRFVLHLGSLGLALSLMTRLAVAAPAALPDDPRLAPIRAQVQAIVAGADRAGLPSEIIVSKVREGLAKGVEPERIERAAQRLADSLGEAHGFVAEKRRGGRVNADLVRAVAEARIAGVSLADAEPLVRESRPEGDSVRAVEVLTDLSLRGYPSGGASHLLVHVLDREPAAVPRMPMALETVRREQKLTPAESLEVLGRRLAQGGSVQAATRAATDDRRRDEAAHGNGKGGEGTDTPGNSGFVPPGQLKKETGQAKAHPDNPGRGLGRMK